MVGFALHCPRLLALLACLGLVAGCSTRPLAPEAEPPSSPGLASHEALVQPKLMQYQTIGGIVVGVTRTVSGVSLQRSR